MFLNEPKLILLHSIKWFPVFLYITNNSVIKQISDASLNIIFYTQLNDQTVQFLTIQFSISHLFAHSLNAKQFYLIYRYDYQMLSLGRVDPEAMAMKGYFIFPKVQEWSFSTRVFDVIFSTLIG